MEEEDNIIVKWAQEDVETSYNLLNKNKNKILLLVQCTDIAADRPPAISVHCTKAVYTVKCAPEDGRVCRPKRVEQIQIDQ